MGVMGRMGSMVFRDLRVGQPAHLDRVRFGIAPVRESAGFSIRGARDKPTLPATAPQETESWKSTAWVGIGHCKCRGSVPGAIANRTRSCAPDYGVTWYSFGTSAAQAPLKSRNTGVRLFPPVSFPPFAPLSSTNQRRCCWLPRT